MASDLGQPLKWHGGKNYIARDIVALMPRHRNYVEPYAGGLAVLFARDPDDERLWLPPHKGVSEVVNDIDRRLTNFWRVLRPGPAFEEFLRTVQAIPFSGIEFADAQHALESDCNHPKPCVPCAVNFFVVNRQSLAGRMKGFTGITKTRTRARMNNEVSAWQSTVKGLPAVHARLWRVLVLPPQAALRVIENKKFNKPETLFYLDPPYLHATRATTGEYAHEMTNADHEELLATLRQCKSQIMLSGYACPLYDQTLSAWNRHTFAVPNQASSAKVKERKTEVVWCNF
jgi:DNA adenine methylase